MEPFPSTSSYFSDEAAVTEVKINTGRTVSLKPTSLLFLSDREKQSWKPLIGRSKNFCLIDLSTTERR
jgi:predicted phosphatase